MDKTPLKPRITVRGYLDGESSYGFLAEQITIGLADNGWDPSIYPYHIKPNAQIPKAVADRIVRREQQEDWEIVAYPPTEEKRFKSSPIHLTMWETPRLSQGRVKVLNECAAIIVPSEHNVYSFSASGVTVPIYRVPLGINSDVFKYAPQRSDGPFIFNAAGRLHGIWRDSENGRKFEPLDDRKNIHAVIKAFKLAFPKKKNDNVLLKIKAYPDQMSITESDSRISLIEADLSQRELHRFYTDSNCFVSASRMEGWGWMQQESMASGRPVIAPITGGLREFMDDRNSYAVDYDYVEAGQFYEGGGLWAEPSVESIAKQMRRAFKHREELREKSVMAAASASRFTLEEFGRNLAKAVNQITQANDEPPKTTNSDRRSSVKSRRRRVRRGGHENPPAKPPTRLRFRSG